MWKPIALLFVVLLALEFSHGLEGEATAFKRFKIRRARVNAKLNRVSNLCQKMLDKLSLPVKIQKDLGPRQMQSCLCALERAALRSKQVSMVLSLTIESPPAEFSEVFKTLYEKAKEVFKIQNEDSIDSSIVGALTAITESGSLVACLSNPEDHPADIGARGLSCPLDKICKSHKCYKFANDPATYTDGGVPGGCQKSPNAGSIKTNLAGTCTLGRANTCIAATAGEKCRGRCVCNPSRFVGPISCVCLSRVGANFVPFWCATVETIA
jgi:hypothetical protein